MNQRDVQYLSFRFPHYYGRINTTKIDIKQLSRCLQRNNIKANNPFLAYSITEKQDQQKKQDNVSFEQLINRINNTLQSKNDGMAIDMIMQTLDKDKDGFLGVEDILSMNQQLGIQLTEQMLSEIMEKITQEGTKISKAQLAKILQL